MQKTLQKNDSSDHSINLNIYKLLYDLIMKDKFVLQ